MVFAIIFGGWNDALRKHDPSSFLQLATLQSILEDFDVVFIIPIMEYVVHEVNANRFCSHPGGLRSKEVRRFEVETAGRREI